MIQEVWYAIKQRNQTNGHVVVFSFVTDINFGVKNCKHENIFDKHY